MKSIESKKKKLAGVIDANSMLSATSINRRKVEPVSVGWKCEYCQADFKSETMFMRHRCTQMERAQDIRSVDGQAAYQYYCEWFRTLKRKAPPIETFIHSRNYNAFKNLVEFFCKINIASSSNYIKFMASNDISPVLWCRDQSYSMYLVYVEKDQSPSESVKVTVEFVKAQANIAEISAGEFISVMTLDDIAVLSQRRLLSPYFLIFSSEFRKILTAASNDERNTFVKRVPLGHYATKLAADELLTSTIRTMVQLENL